MERHASFRDWRLSQGVKRLTDPRPCGRKVERKVVENARGGELEAYRRERAGWIGKKEEREREGDGNNRWEGWGMDAVIWRCMHHRLCHLAREDRPT